MNPQILDKRQQLQELKTHLEVMEKFKHTIENSEYLGAKARVIALGLNFLSEYNNGVRAQISQLTIDIAKTPEGPQMPLPAEQPVESGVQTNPRPITVESGEGSDADQSPSLA